MLAAPAVSRKTQKQQTRQRLLRVAFRQFSEKGLTATRTLDIARKAGVAHGTIFVHFPSREELLVKVIEKFGEKVTRKMHELAYRGKGVRDVLEAHLEGLAQYEAFYGRLVAERHLLPRQARDTLLGIQSAISFHLFEAAQKEMAAGKIKQVPMHLLFNTWIGLVHQYLQNRDLFAPGGSVIARYGSELLDHFMKLLSTEKGER
ncbi:MAG: TetR/AcrR family transcriptional regulator [Deltaproteobacteria bacterium]|nr:TetR/AcrR family transcriptional regulator [Deltaproteobacteria bacterium]